MIANYGYMDGSGDYYITIDTDKCIDCETQDCVTACPKEMFLIEADDYDDEVASIKKEFRKKIKYECAACKPMTDRQPLPCVAACEPEAISHSW